MQGAEPMFDRLSSLVAALTLIAVAAIFAALAGGLYVFHQHGMSSRVLDPDSSVRVFSMAVIGGLGSIPGALLGATYMTIVDYSSFTREVYVRLLATGVGTLVILMFIPGGLGSVMYSVRDAALRFIARRRNIVVPSLLADVRVEDGLQNDGVHTIRSTQKVGVLVFGFDAFVSYGYVAGLNLDPTPI